MLEIAGLVQLADELAAVLEVPVAGPVIDVQFPVITSRGVAAPAGDFDSILDEFIARPAAQAVNVFADRVELLICHDRDASCVRLARSKFRAGDLRVGKTDLVNLKHKVAAAVIGEIDFPQAVQLQRSATGEFFERNGDLPPSAVDLVEPAGCQIDPGAGDGSIGPLDVVDKRNAKRRSLRLRDLSDLEHERIVARGVVTGVFGEPAFPVDTAAAPAVAVEAQFEPLAGFADAGLVGDSQAALGSQFGPRLARGRVAGPDYESLGLRLGGRSAGFLGRFVGGGSGIGRHNE